MKKSIFALVLFLITSITYAQVTSIFGVDTQAFLKDEKNIIRYNPLNIFDNKSDTVFAINKKSFDKSKPIIQIYLGNTIDINEIKIKGGYFDKKYFKSNYRIKSGVIVLFNEEKELTRNNFFLTDEMSIQSIKFESVYKICKVQIYITELYDFEKWDDIVISDISFNLNNKDYSFDYGISYTNSNVSYKEENEYNEKNQLIHQFKDYPPFWGYHYIYKYDSNGRLIFSWRDGGDGPGDTYVLYEYPDLKSKYPSEIQKFENLGKIPWDEYGIIINPYTIDSKGKILKINDYYETIENTYENNLLVKKVKTAKNTNEEFVYYYQDEKCILEKETTDFIYDHIYIYKYENDKLKYKIPIKTDGTDICFFEYFYDNDKLMKVNGYTHKLR